MEPSDSYYKTKRAFLLFVGCLLLAIFVGFKISDNTQRISVLPFSLEKPQYLSAIFAVLVVFYLFQFALQWAAQKAEVQVNQFHRIDFLTSVSIGVVSLICFAAQILYENIQAFSLVFDKPETKVILAIVSAALGAASSSFILEVSTSIGRWIKGTARKEDEALFTIAVSGRWMLYYNPENQMVKKVITFLDNGSIGEGKNENESSWRVRNELLEILNSHDQIFSRFTYIPASERFVHTNDPDTLSIRSQTISRIAGDNG